MHWFLSFNKMGSIFKLVGFPFYMNLSFRAKSEEHSDLKFVFMHIFFICHWYNYSADDLVEDQHPEHPIIQEYNDNMNAREVL